MAGGTGKVPFTKDTVMTCKCGSCPIHLQSACIKQLVANLGEHMAVLDQEPLRRDQIPGAYCAAGRGPCEDLDFRNSCVCGTCEIFQDEYRLAADGPSGYFCQGGRA